MNLQEFVTETIKQIVDGVVAAQAYAKTCGAYVNPPLKKDTSGYALGSTVIDARGLPEPREIEFDVAVTTSTSADLKGGMGIFVAGVGVGYQAKKADARNELSRVKFSIPIVLPSQAEIDKPAK